MKVKEIVIIFLSVLFAIVLGVYAQDIASLFGKDLKIIVLVVTTLISMGLFVVATILELMILSSGKIKSRISSMILTVVLMITVIVGLFVSWWSFFVMVMSLG